MSLWFSEEGANPTIGTVGEWSEEQEFKIEVIVSKENKEKAIKAIREAHPYEEPVINVFDLVQFKTRKETGGDGI